MGIHFKAFCDAQRKTSTGHVLDLIDMTDNHKDASVIAYMQDQAGGKKLAGFFYLATAKSKNFYYAQYEERMQDAIDLYNEGVDLDKELAGDTPISDAERVCV
jgi:hypothetical protein